MKIKELFDSDKPFLKALVKADVIKPVAFDYYKYYLFYENLIAMPKMERYSFTAEAFGVDERTIIRAINYMNEEIQV